MEIDSITEIIEPYKDINIIYLDTEDCTHYNIDNITASELFEIAYSVGYIIGNEYEQ